ncbi:RsiV family protein [Mannheimia haemolytica]
MKKSLLALLIGSVFLISACEDGKMTQTVLEAEKQIVQLGTELKNAQADLAKKEAEVAELSGVKAENEKLKSELENAQQNTALNVEIVKIFDKKEVIKHQVDPKQEFAIEESTVSAFVSLPKTNFDWLNQLLINQAYDYNEEQGRKLKNPTEEEFKKHREAVYQGLVESVKTEPAIGYDDHISSAFIGQRNNIATFTMMHYTYMGGAHGMHYTQYINVDLAKKAIIGLNDLISPKNQVQLKDILWENYSSVRVDENGNYNGFADKKEFRISDQFYFTPHGIAFVYPPYELGAYAEGDIEVEADWYLINKLLNSEYQRGEKDGFFEELDN